ncbi:DUF3263 domain-containing protein [Rothia sp. CCM 9417]|uniref:DUF3263 domain-containing protein n=1 Tax=Rothia sp. CCM 9417 TaxID=3402657 RepID=UPI003AE15EB1
MNMPAGSPTPESQTSSTHRLTEQERAILDMEKKRFKYQGSKEQAISKDLGLSPIAYYQQLNALIDNPRAIAAEPALTRKLRLSRNRLT